MLVCHDSNDRRGTADLEAVIKLQFTLPVIGADE